ncbi:MAG: TlpA disulfide reductase family protein [Bacteroidota bacterium]
MKKLLVLLILINVSVSVWAQKAFMIKVHLSNSKGFPLLLKYKAGAQEILDTLAIDVNGHAVFEGRVKEPTVAYISVLDSTLNFRAAPLYKRIITPPPVEFTLSTAPINISGRADSIVLAEVSGGLNGEWNNLRKIFSRFELELLQVQKVTAQAYRETKATSLLLEPGNVAIKNYATGDSLKKRYIEEYPRNFLSLYFLDAIKQKYNAEELEEVFARLSGAYKKSSIGASLKERIRINSEVKIGKYATGFSKTDINSKTVSLKDFKGKYVLLDFWGSWCGPCIKSFPNLITQYEKYHVKGFEIIGIAREMNTDMVKATKLWKESVEKNKLPWLQVLNYDGPNPVDLVKQFAVSAFPTQILIDKEGKIIEIFIGENPKLNEKLAKIFGETNLIN